MKNITTKKKHDKDFNRLIELLAQEFKPLQIYQFAKLQHREKRNSVFAKHQVLNQWTYYLFIVTDGNGTSIRAIQDFVNANFSTGKVIVLNETQKNLLRGQHNCNGFYASIIHSGKLCYSSRTEQGYTALKQPNVGKFLGRAILHWRNRLKMAQGFLEAGEQALEAGHERVCLFLLYQASDQLCKGLIFVFMGYQEKYGNLERLLYISACFSSLPLQHYTGTPDNEALLEMMCKSIALDNCKSDELPADKSIYRFLELVESFLKLTEKLCVEQFAVLQKEVDKMKELRLQNCYLLATDQIL